MKLTIKIVKSNNLIENTEYIDEEYLKETAFYISYLKKASSTLNENNSPRSIATPIFDNKDKIVGYIGILFKEMCDFREFSVILELLSRLITFELYKGNVQRTLENVNKEFFIDYLSKTELEILRLIVEGKTDKEIALMQHISISTVRSHISKIFGKLKVT